MARTKHFRDLLVWQKSMEMARNAYRASAAFPKDEVFGLRSQLRRAAVSVPSNIAEGHGRTSDKAFFVFLGHARGSLYELQTQIQLASDLGYFAEDASVDLAAQCDEIAKMLNSLMNVLKENA